PGVLTPGFFIGKWFLRKYILGADENQPEEVSKKRANFFIIYAILTWLYRFFLFLAIAVIVYNFAFKALGIILFITEIFWFIVLPIYKELKVWTTKIKDVRLNMRNLTSLSIFIGFIFLLVYPWNTKVRMPAVIEVNKLNNYYVKDDVQIETVHFEDGKKVKKGDLLITFSSKQNLYELEQIKKQIKLISMKLNKVAAKRDILNNRLILQQRLLQKQRQKSVLQKRIKQLKVEAKFDGIVYANQVLHKNKWVNQQQPIFTLFDSKEATLKAYCKQEDLSSLSVDAKATFFLKSGDVKPLEAKVIDISNVSLGYLKYQELASIYNGSIAISKDSNNQLRTQKAYYEVQAKILENIHQLNNQRRVGTLVVDSQPRSIIKQIYLNIAAVFIKESNF
ncbi:MAG: HlyD family efflux transporter periplasmic adaptor subunit, partial [Campylobacterota bacterium]